MDESEDRAAVLPAKQAMIADQAVAEFGNFLDERFPLVVIVMQMNFDVPNTKAHHLGNAFDHVALIVFLRIEETVLRPLSGGVTWSGIGNARPVISPPAYSGHGRFERSTQPQGLIVVADGDPCTLRRRCPSASPEA